MLYEELKTIKTDMLLKNREDYDNESFRLIEIWDIENGKKRGD